MDMLTKMNAALEYIEKNLTEEIDFSIVAILNIIQKFFFGMCIKKFLVKFAFFIESVANIMQFR